MRKQKIITGKSKNNKKEIMFHQEQYSGIIPHPNIINGYEKNCPGATDRILTMTENQLKCNQELARKNQDSINECRKEALKSEIQNIKRGQTLGFILLLVMVIGGFLLIILGKEIGGYVSIIASIMLGVGSVIWNRKKE